jgi:hypothetical protein
MQAAQAQLELAQAKARLLGRLGLPSDAPPDQVADVDAAHVLADVCWAGGLSITKTWLLMPWPMEQGPVRRQELLARWRSLARLPYFFSFSN